MTDKKWIAQSDSDGHWEVIEKGEESDLLVADLASEEDAYLIAAAPDLLEALLYYSEHCRGVQCNIEDTRSIFNDMAQAAIAKAEVTK
jgi:hypothetical protein